MEHASKYVAKKPNADGVIPYTDEENSVWHDLITRQMDTVEKRACDEFLRGLDILNMPIDHIPQPYEMNAALSKATGWTVSPVEALIHVDEFFTLLSKRQFPAATFIRRRDELDYLQEPDIFHEFFGHCPLLTDPICADFMQEYGTIALKANEKERELLARLYWFTIEFGLIKTNDGYKCYGGGILSSKEETIYAVESNIPERRPYANGLDALRTRYRIDMLQTIYYAIESFEQLFNSTQNGNIHDLLENYQQLGDFPAHFPLTEEEKMLLRC